MAILHNETAAEARHAGEATGWSASLEGPICIGTKRPVDLEQELNHYHGNIFHTALTFPFAENSDSIGTWGVETEFPNVFSCGSSARRGGAVSGIPGHNAAMKVLEILKPA